MTADGAARLPPIDPTALGRDGTDLVQLIEHADQAGAFPFRITDDDGHLIGMFRVFVHAPTLGQAIAQIGFAINSSVVLSERARHIAILVVAVGHQSDYEWYAHEKAAQGSLTEEEVARLRRRAPLALDDDAEQVSHDVARALVDTGDLSDDLYERATAVLGRSGLVELVWIVGLYAASALQLRVHRLGPPTGEPVGEWPTDG